MSTSVQINAYCGDHLEVLVRQGNGEAINETILLNNESMTVTVCDDEFISVQERSVTRSINSDAEADSNNAVDPYEEYRGG